MTDKTPLEELAEYALRKVVFGRINVYHNLQIDEDDIARYCIGEFSVHQQESGVRFYKHPGRIDMLRTTLSDDPVTFNQCKAFIDGLAALYGGGDE